MLQPLGLLQHWLGILGFQALGFALMAATAALAVAVVPPSVYGDYWVLLSIAQVGSGVALSWVSQSLLVCAREEVLASGGMSRTLATGLVLQAIVFVPLCLLAAVLAPWLSKHLPLTPSVLVLLAACIALMAVFESVSYALQSTERFEGLGAGAAMTKLGPLLAVAAIWAGVEAAAVPLLAGLAAGFSAALVVAVWALPRTGMPRTCRPDTQVMRRIVAYGRWLPVASAAGVVATWAHVWFVRVYGGAAEAGVYGWAASLHALVGAAIMPISAVIAPHLVDLVLGGQHERSRHRADLFMAVAVLAVAATPAVLGAVALAVAALPVSYAGAGPVLVLLLSAVPAQLFCYLAGPLLRAREGMIARVVVVNVLIAGLTIALNAVLTPAFGGPGAAAAMSLALWGGAGAFSWFTAGAVHSGSESIGRSLALALGGASVATGSALGLAILAPGLAFSVGVALSVVVLLAARRGGWLAPLAAFAYHLSFLPHVLRRPLTRFFDWCHTGQGAGTRDGTV